MPRTSTVSVLRTLGLATLGLLGGVLAAIVLQDVLFRALIPAGVAPRTLGAVLSGLPVMLGVVGAVLAGWLDRRQRRRD